MKEYYMNEALNEAKKAFDEDEVPIGCVIVHHDVIVARAHNMRQQNNDATDHAEMIAIREASNVLNTWCLDECELYVTIEPCAMCAGAIMLSRIKKVYYGSTNSKFGSISSNVMMYEVKNFNHSPEVEKGIMRKETEQIMRDYFVNKRTK